MSPLCPRRTSYFARTNFRSGNKLFGIKQDDRLSHVYMIGKTGVGKSSLIETLARQDLEAGRGFALIDPHGDLVEKLAATLPAEIRERVTYLNAPDPSQPYGYNPLRRIRDDKIPLAVSGLLETLRKLWPDAWGVRMEHVLRNCLYALLERDDSQLTYVLRLCGNESFRKTFVRDIRNDVVRNFWTHEFPNYPARLRAEACAPIQNKLGALLSDPRLYGILVEPAIDLHFRRMMDEGNVLLVNVSKGRLLGRSVQKRCGRNTTPGPPELVARRHDPRVSGILRLHWPPGSLCPCGSGKKAIDCCQLLDGQFYKRPSGHNPPGEATGHSHAMCYLRHTHNCSDKGARDHVLSAAILRIVDEKVIYVKGAPWHKNGSSDVRGYAINNLASNILCKRHNEALSVLDSAAAGFFLAIREIYDDMANVKSLSLKSRSYLFSGEEIELWLMKTAIGLYAAGFLALGSQPLRDRQMLNQEIIERFVAGRVSRPCGLYIMSPQNSLLGRRDSIDISFALSSDELHFTGAGLAFMGVTLFIALDPISSYSALQRGFTYRPSCLRFENKRRHHRVILTWPGGTAGRQRAVLFRTRSRVA